jgi:hypothetical protein
MIGPQRVGVDQQNAILAVLHAAGIHYIRAGIAADDKGVDFARRAQAQGIRIAWLVQLQYRPGAPITPYPNTFGTWGGPPLSAADPDEFRKYIEPLFAKVEAAAVTLAGFELGNEIKVLGLLYYSWLDSPSGPLRRLSAQSFDGDRAPGARDLPGRGGQPSLVRQGPHAFTLLSRQTTACVVSAS